MKTAILLILFLGITFLGCSDNFDDSIVSTSNDEKKFKAFEIIPSDNKNPNDLILEDDSYVERAGNNSDLKKLSVTKTIIGGTTDSLFIDTSYVNYQGRLLNVYARLKVKDTAFQGTRELTMILHPEEATIELFPHMIFDKEVELKVVYQGIDLEVLGYTENADIYFVFFNENGDIEVIDDKTAKVNVDEQRIKVRNAKLSHFSRYGWIRKLQ